MERKKNIILIILMIVFTILFSLSLSAQKRTLKTDAIIIDGVTVRGLAKDASAIDAGSPDRVATAQAIKAALDALPVGSTDSTRLVSDSILVYYSAGVESGRDTLRGLGGGVQQVNGQTGTVTLTTDDVAEGINEYYDDTKVAASPAVVANTAKRSYPTADESKLAGIPADAINGATASQIAGDSTRTISRISNTALKGDGFKIANRRTLITRNYTPTSNPLQDEVNGNLSVINEDYENTGVFAVPVTFPFTPTYPIGISASGFITPYSDAEKAAELLAQIPENSEVRYVSPYGNNTTGTSWATAYNTFTSAFAADPDVIYVYGGYYDVTNGWSGGSVRPATGTKNLAVIAVNGRVTVGKTSYVNADVPTEFPNMVARRGYLADTRYVYDMRRKDKYGAYIPLREVDSRTKCGNTPNSYYDGFGTVDSVYINLGGDTPVYGENYFVHQISTAIFLEPTGGGRRIYLQGIDFYGSPVAEETNGEVVAVDCGFFYGEAAGFRSTNNTNATLVNCRIAYPLGDGFGVFGGQHSHINLVSEYAGFGASDGTFNRQNSSLHDGASLVSINSTYRYAYGQNVADTGAAGASYAVYLNATIGETFQKGNAGVTLQPAVTASQASIWLQRCKVGGRNSFDFRTETGGNIYLLDTPWQSPSIGGGSFNYWKN